MSIILCLICILKSYKFCPLKTKINIILLQAVNTVVAGILHDVTDDTLENLRTIKEEFGDDVAHLVAGVSKLSYINQVCHYIFVKLYKPCNFACETRFTICELTDMKLYTVASLLLSPSVDSLFFSFSF